jgi:LysR family transcriptional regulator, regulator for bpeEF and oprC
METMSLDLVRIFVKVVQSGSFSKAGLHLRLPKSTVSKSVAKLERETGTKLLLRTTRSLTLTAAGRAFYESCLGPMNSIEEAQRSLQGQDSMLHGTLKITAPEDLGNEVIAPAVAKLARRHPSLRFELLFTDEVVDLVEQGFDLAVRIGKLGVSGLKAKKIGEVTLVPVAAPSYLKSREKIEKPRDLLNHDCLSLYARAASAEWTLRSARETVRVPVQTRITANQMSSLLRAATAGAGVAFVPSYFCRRELESGKLERVLPAWTGESLGVSLVSPLSISSAARLKLVGEFLFTEVQKGLA